MKMASVNSKRSRIDGTTRGTRSQHFSRNFHYSNLAPIQKGITNTILCLLCRFYFRSSGDPS